MKTIDTILGWAFASLSAEQQAEVLNAAGSYAHHTYDDEYRITMQGCAIAEKLDRDGWRLLRAIVKFAPENP